MLEGKMPLEYIYKVLFAAIYDHLFIMLNEYRKGKFIKTF